MVAQNFSNQNLVGNNFSGQNLNGSTFFKARLENVLFRRNAPGTRTQLRGTNFEEAFLLNVDATDAIFAANTNFEPATFYKATLEGVNFSRKPNWGKSVAHQHKIHQPVQRQPDQCHSP